MCRDSNKTSLLTALASHQVDVRDGGIARDDLDTLTSSLQAALETSDLVVSLVTLDPLELQTKGCEDFTITEAHHLVESATPAPKHGKS